MHLSNVLNRGYVRNRDDVVLLITESPEDEKKKKNLHYNTRSLIIALKLYHDLVLT